VSERVLVTGGLGRLGRVVCDDLVNHDYDVVVLDRSPATEPVPARIRTVVGEVTDVGHVAQALQGCDALIHLAAIPAPYGCADTKVFANNTQATFAALQAASLLGVRRVAIASSGSAYGTAWSPEPTHAIFVPLDETHPLRNHDAYGLSKEVDERTAEMFCRRDAMSVAALRFHWIATREEQLNAIAERRGRPDLQGEKRNLWGYVDVRDAARACRLAIEVARERPYGFRAMNIVAADTLAEQPIEQLLATHLPDVEVRAPISGADGTYAIDRARDVLGWEPQYSWRRIDS
jgi:nucleoside-diphosphate-sugar epimerase